MKYFYSPVEGGFYIEGVHKNIPEDAIAITEAEYQDLLDGQSLGKQIVFKDSKVQLQTKPAPEITWTRIREIRDGKLTSTDWTQMPDSPMSSAAKTDWKSYRQLLRDITKAFQDPSAVVWPTAPDGSS